MPDIIPATSQRDREAAELRAEFPGVVVVWIDRKCEFRAYTNRPTSIKAPTADELAEKLREFGKK
jgi:hypothetical protein